MHDPEGSRYKRKALLDPSGVPLRVTKGHHGDLFLLSLGPFLSSLRVSSLPLRAGSDVASPCMGEGLPYVELSLYTYDIMRMDKQEVKKYEVGS